MTNDNKNIPKLRFPAFKNAPAWETKKLGEVSDIVGGGTPSTSNMEYWNGTIDWYSPIEIGEKIYVDNSQRKITELGLQKSSAKLLPIGTILFTSRAGIGNTAILKKEGTTNQGFQSIVPHENKLDSYFIFSKTAELKRYGEMIGSGSTFVEVSGKQMSQMSIFLPIFQEQKQIGAFFQTLDQHITCQQQKLEKLKERKKALLQKMFPTSTQRVPELRFPEFTNEWQAKKLGDIGNTFTGLSGKNKNDFGHGNAKYITYINVFQNTIADYYGTEIIEIDDKQNNVQYGDVLFTTSSETPNEVGMSTVWLYNENNVYLNSFCFGYRLNIKFDYYFFGYLLRTPTFRNKMELLAQGISRYNISKIKVMEIDVLFPKLEEQQKIGKLFQILDAHITCHQRQLDHLKLRKKALLQQLFV